jgi:hypothetical protein
VLAELELFIGTRDRYMLLTGGVSDDPSRWRGFEIQFQTLREAQLANADGTPLFGQSEEAPPVGDAS